MALKDILEAMEGEIEAEIRRLEEQRASTVSDIRRSAEVESGEIVERHRREIEAPLRQERARRLNRARLASLRATSQARERLYVQALACARERLAAIRASPDYGLILSALVEEALKQIGEEAIVRADPLDANFLISLRSRFPKARFEFDLRSLGGVEARTMDGQIRILNTFEARLEQANETLRQKVMPLFSPES